MTSLSDMSDDQLRVAKDAWERDRTALWARVSSLTGDAYMSAAADYGVLKAQAEAVANEARRRGVRRRASATPHPDAATFEYTVTPEADGVTAIAEGAVQLQDAVRGALASDLRRAVRDLDLIGGRVLRGTFRGALPVNSNTDVENRVLLNIAIPEPCLRSGFAFEHDRVAPADAECGYDYRPVDADDPFSLWTAGEHLVWWDGLVLDQGFTAAAVWWAARQARQAADVLITVAVTAPRSLRLDELKSVTDGLFAAAQWDPAPNSDGVTKLTAKLQRAGIAATEKTVTDLLTDPAGAGLGRCKRLIASDGRLTPDDHLAVAGIVNVKNTSGGSPRLRAALHQTTAAA